MVLIPFLEQSSVPLDFNKHEWIFHNSEIIESVILIHAKQTGCGGSLTWVTL